MSAPTSIRIVPELRAVHVDRHLRGTRAELLFLAENPDLRGTELAPGIRRTTLLGALARLFATPARTLEVPEPLWMRFWPKHAVLALGFRLAGVVRRRRHRVVTYAMENNDFSTLVGGRRRIPAPVRGAVALLIGAVARCTLDRIRFASEASRTTYAALPFVRGIEHSVGLELPTPSATAEPTPRSCVFLGVLEARKGLDVLMAAWPEVERSVPGAVLTVIGSGPLAEVAARWAAESPASRTVLGRLPHADAAAIVQRSAVLVAPSVPDGRWREQIGLPVKEALAAGLTVVTTDQTGLADWLRSHGHRVVGVDTPDLALGVAAAVGAALTDPLDRAAVRAALPAQDGRLAADAWLHA